jgi:hypothetical protein
VSLQHNPHQQYQHGDYGAWPYVELNFLGGLLELDSVQLIDIARGFVGAKCFEHQILHGYRHWTAPYAHAEEIHELCRGPEFTRNAPDGLLELEAVSRLHRLLLGVTQNFPQFGHSWLAEFAEGIQRTMRVKALGFDGREERF